MTRGKAYSTSRLHPQVDSLINGGGGRDDVCPYKIVGQHIQSISFIAFQLHMGIAIDLWAG